MSSVSYSHAREHFAEIWDQLEDNREFAVIHRRGHEDMALIPADELASLRETAYLLGRPGMRSACCRRLPAVDAIEAKRRI